MCNVYENVLLTGDTNGHTSIVPDFTEVDHCISNIFHFDSDMTQFFNQSQALNLKGFSRVRTSVDNKINNIGKKIIDICKNNNMFIINGRFGTDINCGSSTYKENSVIDYFICSAKFLSNLKHFAINEVESLYSDGHALLSLTIIRTQVSSSDINNQLNNNPIKYKWESEKARIFLSSLNIDQIDQLNNYAS